MNYQKYLQSKEWADIRIEVLLKRKFTCERCGKIKKRPGALHVHHKTYERLGKEDPSDLELLCSTCHKKEHFPWMFPKRKPTKKQIKKAVGLKKRKEKVFKSRRFQSYYNKYGGYGL